MAPTGNPIANPAAVLREEFDDWAVLFHPDTAEAVDINRVGVAIWKLMDGSRAVADIAAGVQGQFSAVPDGVVDDVYKFVADLAQRGLVGYALEQVT
jgi:SynChlorMet cassette protein ScmD